MFSANIFEDSVNKKRNLLNHYDDLLLLIYKSNALIQVILSAALDCVPKESLYYFLSVLHDLLQDITLDFLSLNPETKPM
jgi:hypothetical protein